VDRWQAASHRLVALQEAIDDARIELDAAMQMAVERALGTIPQSTGAVIEMREADALVYRAGSGIAATSSGVRFGLENSVSGLCILTGEPQTWVDGLDEGTIPARDAEAGRNVGARSFVAVPLTFNGRNIGVLKIFSSTVTALDERDMLVVQLLANAIMLAFASAERSRLTEAHDALARRFAATFEQAAVGIAHVAPDGRLLMVNDRFCAILDRSSAELLAGDFQQITHTDDLQADLNQVAALIAGEISHYSMEKRYIRGDDSLIWTNLTVSLVRQPDGEPDFFVAVVEDISARKTAEALASNDPLTGLPNRRMVLDQLAHRLSRLPTHHAPLAVAYLDVDRFKRVNDRFGHAEGDRCLIAIADALKGALRTNDLLGRMAGDEFVLILPDADLAATDALLHRLCDAVERLPEYPRWNIGMSAGAIIVPPGTRAEPDLVLNAADQLMYRVKRDRSRSTMVEQLPLDPRIA
jgi:diguanylate cyclase (GGDEF)-like protein/PAS domain S-box-containing protein